MIFHYFVCAALVILAIIFYHIGEHIERIADTLDYIADLKKKI